jgi:hypothetical protein
LREFPEIDLMLAPGPWIIGDLQQRRKRVDFSVARLPVSPVFSSRAEPPAALDGVNDFVVCGVIEPIRLMDLDGCKPAMIRRRSRRAVARRLRFSAEETPPIPMLFLQRLTTSSRNYKARTRIDQPARRAHYFFTPNESPSARTTREVRDFI